MDARTGLVIGGMTAVAASVAVVCVVAMANTAALKDSPATTVAAAKILVPAASPTSAPKTTPTAQAVVTPEQTTQAEVVAAPDPTEVEPSTTTTPVTETVVPSHVDPAPAAPVEPVVPAPAEGPADVDSAIEAARATGTWESLRSWAERHGWSTGRIDALIERLSRGDDNERLDLTQGHDDTPPAQKQSGTADRTGGATAELQPQDQSGSRLTTTTEHPAKAGSNGRGDDAVPTPKKDQSRNSPDRRD
ncbi:hypothetical protein IF188_11705 [Microbacterium sp. NEAU-LLC]|uniref:LysM domain-containing protein n=1 Tax=Microbacterium helvum TaxID=2773713 RepID=A0ABR8NNY9_9MICO|nr:hypothetical protein [Microbacterium helvum]MBD3942364.1 hypothetical protein [Microbacterium helvum]